MRVPVIALVVLFLVPNAIADGISAGGWLATVESHEIATPVIVADSCIEAGQLALGDHVDGNTRNSLQDHRPLARPNVNATDDVYRLVLTETTTVRVDLTTVNSNLFSPVLFSSAGWAGFVYLRTACEDPATEVMWSDWHGALLLNTPEGHTDAWRTLPAGTYWIFVDGWSSGPYSLSVNAIAPPPPIFKTGLSNHVHPANWTSVGFNNVNRDSVFRIVAADGGAEIPLDAVVPSDSATGSRPGTCCGPYNGGQFVQLWIPGGLPDGNYSVEAENAGVVSTRCCLQVVPHIHPPQPSVVASFVGADAPANGVGYAQDERIRLHVHMQNDGDATSGAGNDVCLWGARTQGGNWIDAHITYPALAPGAEVTVPMDFTLPNDVGDVLVRMSCGPQGLFPSLLVASEPNEWVVHMVADGHGAGI